MSGFNLDFSGLFGGGGGFTLDSSKFNFDAYKAPEPKKETVVDPVDVVSDNTPTPEVEVLEGAGTVAVTKSDPVQQAINDLQGKDLTQSLNVNPLASAPVAPTPVAIQPVAPVTPTPDPIAEAIQTVKPLEMPSLSGLGGISGFDVTNKSVDKLLSDSEKQQQVLNPLIADIPNFGIDNFSVQANDGFITESQFNEVKDLMSSGEFNDILTKYNEGMKDTFGDDYDGSFQGYDDKRAVLDSLGINNSFKVYTDELGSFDHMEYNSESGQFEKIEDKSKEVSLANQIVKGVAESVPLTFATAGLGSAISAGFGVSSTTGAAIASGAISAAQGNNLKEVATDAFTAGLSEEIKAAQAAAEVMGATKDVIAYADTIKAIETGVDIVKAVDSGNVLKAVSGVLDLSGNGSPASYIEDALGTTKAQTAGILKVIDKQLQGESLDDSVRSGAAAWVKEGGIKELDLDMDFGDGDWETPEAIKAIGDKLVEGASWANENFIKPVVNTVETLGAGAIEAASQANQFVQREVIDDIEVKLSNLNKDFQAEIEPIKEQFSELNRNVRQDLADFDEQVLQPYVTDQLSIANEQIRQELANFDSEELQPIKKDIEKVISTVDEKLSNFNKDYIKPIDQYLSDANAEFRDRLSDFEDDYIDPVKEDVEGLANDVKEGLSDANEYTREQLANFDDSVLQPIKNDIEGLIDGLDGFDLDMGFVKDLLSGLLGSVGSLGTGLQTVYAQGEARGPDNSALAQLNTQFGEQYQFEDLRNNPLLKNELFA